LSIGFEVETGRVMLSDSDVPACVERLFACTLGQVMPELASSGMPLGDCFVLPSSEQGPSLQRRERADRCEVHVFAHAFRILSERQPVETVTLDGGYYDAEAQIYVVPPRAGGGGTACFVRTTNDGTDQWDRWVDD
jgi:hypothetical protein